MTKIPACTGRRAGSSGAQVELPIPLDSPLTGMVRSGECLLAFPLFDLSKSGSKKRIAYSHNSVWFEVLAVEGQGVATLYDRDLLLYAGTLLIEKLERGENSGNAVVFSARDFYRIAGRVDGGRSAGGSAYDRLEKAVERLKGSLIKTNAEVSGRGSKVMFNWLESGSGFTYELDSSGERRLKHIRVVLNPWICEALRSNRRLLAVHKRYFELKPVSRRLYDLARVHCGDAETSWSTWRTSIGQLLTETGADMTLSQLKRYLVAVEQEDSLLEYRVRVLDEFDRNPAASPKRGRPSITDQVVLLVPGSLDSQTVVLGDEHPKQPMEEAMF
jgi:plasmid replication initiation protein